MKNSPVLKLVIKLSIIFSLLTSVEGKWFDTVVIDPGHGGRDKGAYWGGVRESYLNMIVANKLSYELKARGIKTVMTRHSDRTTGSYNRINLANKYPNAMFVSIHFNAHLNTSVRGIETFYLSSEGKKMASKVQSRLVRGLKGKNRGIKSGNYKVLAGTNAPAILVECGFISNPTERARCKSRWYQTTAARVIADGLMDYRKMR